MFLRVKTRSTENDIVFNTDYNALENAQDQFDGYYVYRVYFDVFAMEEGDIGKECKEIKVAEFTGTFVDDVRCLNDGVDPFYAADSIDQDVATAFENLFYRSRRYKFVSDDDSCVPLVSCYLDRFYVLPEYRGQGIGSYLLKNLDDIIEININRRVWAIVTYPSAFHASDETYTEEERMKMLRTMKRCFKKAGYKELADTNYFIKNCSFDRENKRIES